MPQCIDVRGDRLFVGRTEELYRLVHNLERGKHTLLVGPKGIGKSRLMSEARDVLSGDVRRIEFAPSVLARLRMEIGLRLDPHQYKVVMVDQPVPLSDLLRTMLEQVHSYGDLLLDGDSPAQGEWSILSKQLPVNSRMEEIALRSLRGADRPYLLFIDALDRITPAHHVFIERLLMHAVFCGCVVHMREGFYFEKIWSSFDRIDIGPLSESDSTNLIDHCLETYPVGVTDRELYRREILKSAAGNPFHIKNLLWHGLRERNIDPEEIRKFRKMQKGEYFNMGPLYMFSAGVFTIFRIFSLGTENKEFYIYFSSLGVLVYLTFRIFRAFFLFRPQKYE